MRYRLTDGLVNYFKAMFDNVVYVQDVDQGFSEFEKLSVAKGPEFTKSPALVVISRTSSRIADSFAKPSEFKRGRLVQKPEASGDGYTIKYTTALDCELSFDITILAYDNYVMDTLVDEVIFRILERPTYQYQSGVASTVDGTSEMINECNIRYEGSELGTLEETVSVENGRVYRTTFPVTIEGEIYMSGSTLMARTVPLTITDLN